MASHEALRERLERRLARLEDRVQRIESDLRRPGDPDWPEQATQRENDAVLEGLGSAEKVEMESIRAALSRLDAGTYGRCRVCEAEIPPQRLEVVPFTDTCIACAEAAEG